jgi:GMP synthase (glutamine-hydrolysing)
VSPAPAVSSAARRFTDIVTMPPIRHRSVRVLQHVDPEGPGRISEALASRGITTAVTRADRGEPVPRTLEDDLGLVVMGGPMGVYESHTYPFLLEEQRLIEDTLRRGLPVLGVCLGSQLLAATLGARVAPGPAKEIGWLPVTLRDTARGDALFGAAPSTFTALHWHGDVFDLPAGATPLARSALTEHQAFRYGSAHGILFHLEATPPQVRAMCALFEDELASAKVEKAALLARTASATEELAPIAEGVFGAFATSLVTERP